METNLSTALRRIDLGGVDILLSRVRGNTGSSDGSLKTEAVVQNHLKVYQD